MRFQRGEGTAPFRAREFAALRGAEFIHEMPTARQLPVRERARQMLAEFRRSGRGSKFDHRCDVIPVPVAGRDAEDEDRTDGGMAKEGLFNRLRRHLASRHVDDVASAAEKVQGPVGVYCG